MTSTLSKSAQARARKPQPESPQRLPKTKSRRQARRRRRPWLLRKRLWIVGLPLITFATLIALAPDTPGPGEQGTSASFDNLGEAGGAFRYVPDDEVYALDFDPRKVRIGLLEGWDREQDAFQDTAALAYVTGPMYERHLEAGGQEITVPLGDLKFGQKVWKGRNRTAARQRASIGIRKDGGVDFSYGELTAEKSALYDTFIGGLHSVYNDLEEPPAAYTGAYSISMGQRIRYYLPRIRMVFGLRQDGRLEMLMSKDGLTLEQTRDLARRRGLVSAYLPDHASKSRLIIPGVKGFTEEDANWISGGATSFVHVPYLLRLSQRRAPLRGDLMDNIGLKIRMNQRCSNPLDCSQWFAGRLLDRSLAGLNRVMEQGVEPVARMIWPPRSGPVQRPDRQAEQTLEIPSDRSPLPEPPITADPLVLRESLSPAPNPIRGDSAEQQLSPAEPTLRPTLPPDLPPPLVMPDPVTIPQPSETEGMGERAENDFPADQQPEQFHDAPPPPLLPPPMP